MEYFASALLLSKSGVSFADEEYDEEGADVEMIVVVVVVRVLSTRPRSALVPKML